MFTNTYKKWNKNIVAINILLVNYYKKLQKDVCVRIHSFCIHVFQNAAMLLFNLERTYKTCQLHLVWKVWLERTILLPHWFMFSN